MVRVVPISNFSCMASGNRVCEISKLSEVDALTFMVDRGQPTLIFCNPVDATDARCVMPFAARVPGVFSLRDRPQVFNSVIMSDSVDVVDKIWVNPIYKFPNNSMRNPDCTVGADSDVPLGVEAPCGFSCKDFVPRDVIRTVVPEQLPCVGGIAKNVQQFRLRRQNGDGHIGAPCDVGTSVVDQMRNVKDPVCR